MSDVTLDERFDRRKQFNCIKSKSITLRITRHYFTSLTCRFVDSKPDEIDDDLIIDSGLTGLYSKLSLESIHGFKTWGIKKPLFCLRVCPFIHSSNLSHHSQKPDESQF
jgi:hypothetical protein